MVEDRVENLKEELLRRLTPSNKKQQEIEISAKQKLKLLLDEAGIHRFQQNPDWYINLSVDNVMAEWFRSKTQDLREREGYVEALSSPEVQETIKKHSGRLKGLLKESVLTPGNFDDLRLGTPALGRATNELEGLKNSFDGLFMKIIDTLGHFDIRLRKLEKDQSAESPPETPVSSKDKSKDRTPD